MAYQLVYTSAAKLLDAGRSGFGTVARSRAIPPLIVSAIERVSQFANLRGLDRSRVIYVHRRIIAGNNRFHILSRIADAGADYTGRTNHLAHHLVVSQDEAARAAALNITPADVLQQFTWLKDKAWEGSPRFFTDDDEIPLEQFTAVGLNCTQGAWSKIANNPAHAYLLAGDDAPRTCVLITPDTVAATDRVYALDLLAEALAKFKGQSWSRTFTTSLETTDELSDLDWIVTTPASYPEIQSRCSSRQPYDLTDIEWLRNWSPPELSASDSRPGSSATSGANAPIIGKSNTRIPAPDVATPSYRPYSNMDRLEDTRSKVMSKSQRRNKQRWDRTRNIKMGATVAFIVIVALLVVAFLIGNHRNQAKIHSTQSPPQPAAETKPTPDATNPLKTDHAEGTSDVQVPAPPKEQPIAHQTPENNSTKDPPSANPDNAGNTGEKPPAAVEAIKAPPRQVILVTRKELETGVKVELISDWMTHTLAGKQPPASIESENLPAITVDPNPQNTPEKRKLLLTDPKANAKERDYYCWKKINDDAEPKFFTNGKFSLAKKDVWTVLLSYQNHDAWIVVDEKKDAPVVRDLKFGIQESGATFKLSGTLTDWIKSVFPKDNDLRLIDNTLTAANMAEAPAVSIQEATINGFSNWTLPSLAETIFPIEGRDELQKMLDDIKTNPPKNAGTPLMRLQEAIGKTFTSRILNIKIAELNDDNNLKDLHDKMNTRMKNEMKENIIFKPGSFQERYDAWAVKLAELEIAAKEIMTESNNFNKASDELAEIPEKRGEAARELREIPDEIKKAVNKSAAILEDWKKVENHLRKTEDELKKVQDDAKSKDKKDALDRLGNEKNELEQRRSSLERVKQKPEELRKRQKELEEMPNKLDQRKKELEQRKTDLSAKILSLKTGLKTKEGNTKREIATQHTQFFVTVGKKILANRKSFGMDEFDSYKKVLESSGALVAADTESAIKFIGAFLKKSGTSIDQQKKARVEKVTSLRVQTEGGRVLFEAKKE